MEFSRQEYWSGLSCLPPGDLLNPEIELRSSTLQVDSLPFEPPGSPNSSMYGLISGTERISLHHKTELIPSLEIAVKHHKACTNVTGLPFLSVADSEETFQELAMGLRAGDRWYISSWASAHTTDGPT